MIRNSGFSALELLLALGISSLLLTSMVSLIHSSTGLALRLQTYSEHQDALFKTSDKIQKAIEDIDSHRFELAVRVHKHGKISFQDGSANPVMRSKNKPSINSDALTVMRLDPLHTFRVKFAQLNAETLNLLACRQYSDAYSLKHIHSFLSLSIDNFAELKGQVSTADSQGCRVFILKPQKSMLAPNIQAKDFLNASLIIPIEDLYTLYLDRSTQLRMLRHAGFVNIENQPITNGITHLKFDLTNINPTSTYNLKTKILSYKDARIDTNFVNHLGRSAAYNFLLAFP